MLGQGAKRCTAARLTRAISGCAAAGLIALAPPAGADTDDEAARAHFESGTAYLSRSDYDDALREFKAAYDLSKRPELLLNIATVYERMGRPRDAVDALTQFLNEAPENHPERGTVQHRIENLKKRIPEGESAGAATVADAGAPTSTTAAPPSTAASPPQAERESAPSKLPAMIALGVGGAATIGAVVTGIIAKVKYDDAKDSCKHTCPDSTVAPINRLALVSDILTGVAIVGVGVGTVLLITSSGSSEKPTGVVPRLRVDVGSHGAAAGATWRF